MLQQSVWLRTICLRNSLPIRDEQVVLLEHYVSLLVEWNARINLISRKDVENVWANHILHSISLLFKLRLKDRTKVLDLGSGGGLPGIPLKVMHPSIKLTMLDSTQKKIIAVQDMIQKLSLKDTEAIWGRAEEYGQKREFTQAFDYVVVRGVGPLKDLVRYSIPFLTGVGSRSAGKGQEGPTNVIEPPALIAFKGGQVEEEIKHVSAIKGPRSIKIVPLVFAGSEEMSLADKKLVVIKF